jgi:hypothetical protein
VVITVVIMMMKTPKKMLQHPQNCRLLRNTG